MSLRVELNIVTKNGTGQGAKILIASGKYLPRNCMAATHSWFYFYPLGVNLNYCTFIKNFKCILYNGYYYLNYYRIYTLYLPLCIFCLI